MALGTSLACVRRDNGQLRVTAPAREYSRSAATRASCDPQLHQACPEGKVSLAPSSKQEARTAVTFSGAVRLASLMIRRQMLRDYRTESPLHTVA